MVLPPFSPKIQKFIRGWGVTLSLINLSTVMWYIKIFLIILVCYIIKLFFI